MIQHWFIAEEVGREFAHLRATRQVSAEDQAAHTVAVEARAGRDAPGCLVVAGNVAEIRVEGVLTARPDFWAWLFNEPNTTYPELIAACESAAADPMVDRVQFYVDSPGGEVSGLFDALAAVETLRAAVPVSVYAVNAQSAAYGIAAAAGPIEAHNRAASFGSVGVAVSYLADSPRRPITNSESPDKRPDLDTAHGRGVIVDYLDAIFDLFVGEIAKGRGTSSAHVIEGFGRGRTMLAKDAKAAGLIDAVRGERTAANHTGASSAVETIPPHPVTPGAALTTPATKPPSNTPADASGNETEDMPETPKPVTLASLQADHPELCEQLRAEGCTGERARVLTHLEYGKNIPGAMAMAIGGVESGEECGALQVAKYSGIAMKANAQAARQVDSDAAGGVVDTAAAPPTVAPAAGGGAPTVAQEALDILLRNRGKDS